jgi:DNA-binding Lrp family transcriptional regulator
MDLKPQDVLVALKLCLWGAPESYAKLAKALGISASEAHAAVRRLIEAGLVDSEKRTICRRKFCNFLVHGVPYAFPAKTSELTRGLPTAWAAPVMANHVEQTEPPPIWPTPDGKVRGAAVKPLYASAVVAAQADLALYDLLALVDALRLGRARERNFAEQELTERIVNNVAN